MPKKKEPDAPSEEASPLAMQTDSAPLNESSNDDEETAHQIAEGGAPEPTVQPPLTAERATDIFLGAVSLLAEATGKQVKTLREDGPAILATYEERGRPLREQLLGKLRDGFAPIPDEGEGEASRTAAQDIQALEQRVRELEAEVSPTETTKMAENADTDALPTEPTITAATEPTYAAPEATEELPAEVAEFEAEGIPPFALADSPYAVSETDEEVAQERNENGEAGKDENVKAESDNPGYGAE